MISGPVGFEEIVQSVKDGTGIVNIRPYYERIRRLLFRAEREIGYGGTIILKRCKYKSDTNFNGSYIPYPEDFIEFEGVGTSTGGKFVGSCYLHTGLGLRFRQPQTDVNFLYWGVMCDGMGNPITTRNHEEAVVAFIIWQLYKAKRFLDQGNANTALDYEREWISLCLESRGDDAFPTLDEMDELALLMYSDRRQLIQHPTAAYSYCDDVLMHQCCGGGDDPGPEPTLENVYFWQLNNTVQDYDDVVNELSVEGVTNQAHLPLSAFEAGFTVTYSFTGRIAFAIYETEHENWQIIDALNNDVTSQFQFGYFPDLKIMLFVSIEFYTFSSILFKIKKV